MEERISKNNVFAEFIVNNVVRKSEFAIFVALVLIMALISIGTYKWDGSIPTFLQPSNLYLVSRQISFVAIVAMGELFVILTGGIDLSVGSIIGLGGVITGLALAASINPVIAVLLGLGTGIGIGLFNGFMIAYVGIAPFIVTLAMLSLARGIILIITKGWPVTAIPKEFMFIGQGDFLGIPIPVIVMLFCAIIINFVLKKTAFGRRIFAIGGNEQATFLSGVNVKQVKLAIYGICAFLPALVGIILVARFSSAQSDMGGGWELDAIAAAVIGGTSLAGGSGSVLGVLIGAVIMGVIRNGLVLMRVSPYWQTAIIGAIIIFAAIIDRTKNLKKN
jgi:ribose transport system permease protein